MKSNKLTSLFLFFLDVITLSTLFFIMTVFRHGTTNLPPHFNLSIIICIFISWFVLYTISGYNGSHDMLSLSYTSQHFIALLIALLLTVFSIYIFTLSPSWQFSRSVLPLTYFLFIPLSIYYRRMISIKMISLLKEDYFLVLGVSNLAKKLCEEYQGSGLPQKLRIATTKKTSEREYIFGENSPQIETLPANLAGFIDNRCTGVILADTNVNQSILDNLTAIHFNKVPVMSIESFYERFMQKVHIPGISHFWLLQDGFMLVGATVYDKVKRILDIILSLLLFTLTLPLFLLIPILIKVTSRGPVIYRQSRVGKDRVPFTLHKFRTMKEGSEKGDSYTRVSDERITGLGKFLRRTRLDELPQLWNVLKGDMNFIGPRAEWIKLTEEYEKKIPYYHFRHLVKPGITGWAQVNYPYGEGIQDTIKKLEYDLYYIRHYSPLLDAKIILKTIYVIFFAKGQ
ncbi:MAG: exopolysaccharide biosynthesis polyprenyl glycosylphosphotransferase [Deltaproteobacteria bacterium]|nr:exopolysaccharide biosynthesis polyprenyl glycosylphosphotransferase [Deltaproteobacteria bacterium]